MVSGNLLSGCTPFADFFLALPQEFSPKGMRRDVANQRSQHFKPLVLLFVSVSEEHDLFATWEDQPERPLNAIHGGFVVVTAVASIVFQSDGFLQIDCGGGFLGDVVESNKIASNYAELSTTPRRNVSTILRKSTLEVGHLVPVDVPETAMAFVKALWKLVLRDTRQWWEPEHLENDLSNLLSRILAT